jgi:NAD-dependent SIR2 family protein deacetylase
LCFIENNNVLASDQETYAAIQELVVSAKSRQRPIVFWIGAGASVWAGYPLWSDLASRMHTQFSRQVPQYDRPQAATELEENKFPALFERMRLADRAKFFQELVKTFPTQQPNAVYSRMIRALKSIEPLRILTTNVDECLEHQLGIALVKNSDIERVPSLMQDGSPFICKLHGTVSAVESMVFTTSDYTQLSENQGYLNSLRNLFSTSTVIFLGYSLRDDYLIQLLIESTAQTPLFGSGPHFMVTTGASPKIPPVVKRIRYENEFHDHRDALWALEEFSQCYKNSVGVTVVDKTPSAVPENALGSVYYIADLIPYGTVQTSQSVSFESADKSSGGHMFVGEGYIQGEVFVENYSALHDLIVGLICFDTVCFALDRLSVVHSLLGAETFWELLRLQAIRVVNLPQQSAVIFNDERSVLGSLGDITVVNAGISPILGLQLAYAPSIAAAFA